MGEVLAFAAKKPVAPKAYVRTPEDDVHDTCLWVGTAEDWGWSVREFEAPEHAEISGFMFFHRAVPDEIPLYTLMRAPEGGWRLHSRRRELTEHETLHDALQSIFPTGCPTPNRTR